VKTSAGASSNPIGDWATVIDGLTDRLTQSPSLSTAKAIFMYPRRTIMASYHTLSNNELILRCQDGLNPEKLLFAELIFRYQPYLEMVFISLAPTWPDRADMAQEVWIRVYRNINRLQEPEKFRKWLSRVATNLFYDELRRRKRFIPPLSLDAPFNLAEGERDWELVSNDPEPIARLATQEFYDQLRCAIAGLPDTSRTTIVMREIADLPYGEIAELTGVSLGTVKSRVFRARQYIQGQLASYLND
jgi:RNA polymerase sigma factor (sigma-70 family)